ncbi:MAG: serine hydrolase domain-containing protein, partial [Pseudomonadales bacterium]|nr:serine hydrolase domain-containing protein [Pseudomonadales bacterium]
HGKLVYLQSMGWQDVENNDAMRANSIFQIRSMSKPIVSAAILQLIEQGQLALSDPVARYIPAFGDMQVFINPADPDNSPLRAPTRAMTIEDLLLNMGGLSHRLGPLYTSRQVRSRADTLEQLVAKVAAVPLVADPGTQWVYSISATVLGRIVEIVSGRRFDDYLRTEILQPLSMPDTDFHVPGDKINRLAHPYQVVQDELMLRPIPPMSIPITQAPPLLEGAAGLVSTVPDYLRFLQAMLNGGELDGKRILSTASVATMISNHVPAAALPISLSGSSLPALGWGYGFSVVIDETQSAYGVNNGEFGWNGSLGTFSWADPETQTIAILMMQVAPAGAWNLSALFKTLVSQALID